jgi:hypothetical protein
MDHAAEMPCGDTPVYTKFIEIWYFGSSNINALRFS